jgi:hypothetical protein
MTKPAHVVLEIEGEEQMEVVKMMLADTEKFEEVGVWKDMAGASRCIVDYWLGF